MSDPVHGGLLTVVDYAAIAIVLGSMLLGMLRGLVRELFNLVGWVVAFFVARAFGPTLAHWLPADLPGGEMTQGAIGFLLVLVAVVFGAGIVSALVGRMTDMIGLRPADRGLGMVFGIVRGMLLLILLMVAAKLTVLPQQPVWQQSLVRPWVEAGLARLVPYLPEPVQHYLHNPEAAVPSGNPLGTPIPLPQLAPYRVMPESGEQGRHGTPGHPDGERGDGTSSASGTSGSAGVGVLGGSGLGTGLTGDGLHGRGADAQSQGWGMRSGGAGGAGGSAAPSTGLHKVSE
ncbi:CvpA family protein [Pandoraea terrigena]|uniref:Colicin v production transmembrane protein n=1 Tax=Pandoraea terrigena TaxID=2508292 RepID=A0A5E4TXZ6_9BURK|nr:CvpA family protein [Pandoraea terrigena]VVD91618.1 colicin v production transmembrane protein [Pandoraea terrigena]